MKQKWTTVYRLLSLKTTSIMQDAWLLRQNKQQGDIPTHRWLSTQLRQYFNTCGFGLILSTDECLQQSYSEWHGRTDSATSTFRTEGSGATSGHSDSSRYPVALLFRVWDKVPSWKWSRSIKKAGGGREEINKQRELYHKEQS